MTGPPLLPGLTRCRASIEENDDDLLADWQAREARKELGRKIWGWGCLTIVLLVVALSILDSLLR